MKVCKNGSHHYEVTLRECPECHRNRKRKWKKENPDKYAEQKSRHLDLHKNEILLRGIWRGMIRRCTNPEAEGYEYYGGRGITVCERWLNYDNFIADMGGRPSLEYSIDRKNNDLGYFKENCRWATHTEQARNRSCNAVLTHNGESKCLSEWAEMFSIPVSTVSSRLDRGWVFEEALGLKVRLHEVGFKDWCSSMGIDYDLTQSRMNSGMTFEDALKIPKGLHSDCWSPDPSIKLCRKGHSYDSTKKECPLCRKERKKNWERDHPEELKAQKASYRAKL